MIMMKSKPPPPVPPRPSKSLVAEALAKTRRSPDVDFPAPVRAAPVPPPAIKIQRRKSPQCDALRESTRTIIFQSNKFGKVDVDQLPLINNNIGKNAVVKARNGLEPADSLMAIKNDAVVEAPPDEPKETKLDGDSTEKLDGNESTAKSPENDVVHVGEVNGVENNHATTATTTLDEEENTVAVNDILNGKNHVNTLIDEMFASILDLPEDEGQCTPSPEAVNANVKCDESDMVIAPPIATILVIDRPKEEHSGESSDARSSTTSTVEKKTYKRVQFDDKHNHELLIAELQSMREEQERISKRQRKPSQELYANGINDDDGDDEGNAEEDGRIHHSDWVEIADGQEVRLSSCQITIDDICVEDRDDDDDDDSPPPIISRLSTMSALYGLPPLPKSLSGFSLLDRRPHTPNRGGGTPVTPGHGTHPVHPRVNGTDGGGTTATTTGRKGNSNLDAQLAILRREMYSLRQLDLSLLSQLWSLNESIQDFRQMLQDQEDRPLSPPSPSPSPSSCDDGDDEFFSPAPIRLRPAPPPPPLRRTSNSSSANSSEYGTV